VEEQKSKLDAAKIESFLQMAVNSAGFDLKFKIGPAENLHPDFENPEIVVAFTGRDVDLLLSNKAELLLALEQLAMEALRLNQNEHSLLQFDANDYRMLRIEELRLSALTAAEKVKRIKQPFEFNPMNSRERRIIHLALRNEPDVRSESMGSGPYRQVIVYPAGMPSLPAKPQPAGPPPRRPQSGPPPRRSGGRPDRRR
jgi:spoIIIJ-associated protein